MATTASTLRSASERRFFAWGAALIVLVAFGGFARTYYLKVAFGTPSLSTLVHVHAAVMTAWVILFVTQTCLIAARRTDLHRRLGVFGVILLALIVVIGIDTAIESARRGLSPTAMPPLMFLVIPLGTVFVFAVLAGAAILYRHRSDFQFSPPCHEKRRIVCCCGLKCSRLVGKRRVLSSLSFFLF